MEILNFYKFRNRYDKQILSLLNDVVYLGGGALRKIVDKKEKVVDYDLFLVP